MSEQDEPTATPPLRPLVVLRGAGVSRGGATLLSGADFRLMPGTRWAVLGENGAGKSTFLRLLRGDIAPDHADAGGDPTRIYDLPGQGGEQTSPLGLRQRLGLVSGDMQDLYARNEWAITAFETVLTGFYDSPLLYAEPTDDERAAARETLAALGLTALADRRMATLSSGQGRAVLLARALACRPDALLLDECLEGLDAPSRREFLAALDRAAGAAPGLAMLFCSHRADELPACLTHALVVESGRLRESGPIAGVTAAWERRRARERTAADGPAPMDAKGSPKAADAAQRLVLAPPPPERDFLLRVTGADVVVDGAAILHGVNWTIRPGENWAVLGRNGAGKSTLLSLVAGDFWPSALSGEPGRVEYGFARPGETLDDTRRRIGRVSAVLDRDYGWNLTVEEVVWSGAHGSIGLYAETGAAAKTRAAALLAFFGMADLAARRIDGLSRGQLRRVMLARALMGFEAEGPALLLLDEPMAGLDARSRRAARALLNRLAASGAPLVMVTHHERDLPERVDHVLIVEAGRVAFAGPRADYVKWRDERNGTAGDKG